MLYNHFWLNLFHYLAIMISILAHLRIPFSFLLLPVYLFALSISPNFTENGILWVFIILHFLLYPASNGYNSFYDKDKGSIGLLKNPPKVNTGLLWVSNLLDFSAFYLAYTKIGLGFCIGIILYSLVSRAYSHPSIRLKKYPWLGWTVAGLFQGFVSFVIAYMGLNGFPLDVIIKPQVLVPAFLCSLLLWGSFPLTQIYQHSEDAERGDFTLSRVLGIQGTFRFAAGMFLVADLGFILYFNHFFASKYALVFQFFLVPIVLYFMFWYFMVHKNQKNASYAYTMGMNLISALCLNAFFIWFWLDRTNLSQVFD
jgi:hypothetical protein